MIETYLENVAVIGAGGKMGSGISLLLLQEMTLQAEEQQTHATLTLIDTNEKSLYPLKQYLRTQITKFAEKNMIKLRDLYKNNPQLISNEDIIEHFVNRALDFTNFSFIIDSAKNAKLVFEAIIEQAPIKIELYKFLKEKCSNETFFLTNTSSIPISYINQEASLNNRIIGYHFYNPPAIQKLLEIISPENVDTQLTSIANELAKRLKKTVVNSSDVAGFIGNGHFIPEGIFACQQVNTLANQHPTHEAVYLINRVTQDYLIRPMGIFQLIDYVGIDVFQNIAKTMRTHLHNDAFQHPLIDAMVENNVLGGQHPDGSQKDGFFQYAGTKIIGYYDFDKKNYQPIENANWIDSCNKELGPLPEGHSPWKNLVKDRQQQDKLQQYLHHLSIGTHTGEQLACEYLHHSFNVAKQLVDNNIAQSLSEVSTVLKTGFFHLYGPDASWIQHNETVGSC
jgi:3-hydroxybutyryl-CoA dehydrogenase